MKLRVDSLGFYWVQDIGKCLATAIVIFLNSETKNLTPNIKGRNDYFEPQFVEV